uniref:Uncharacterized protein n=1 Tax=Glossina brevipalpis TaxID=37001 RepID=A0A1A9W0R2_9MUSC
MLKDTRCVCVRVCEIKTPFIFFLCLFSFFFILVFPFTSCTSISSIEDHVVLEHRLRCKPFKWYLENVFQDLQTPESYLLG